MNLSFSVPNPLSRLTSLLDAVERSRAQAAAERESNALPLDEAGDPHVLPPADRNDDLDSLSLSRCGGSLEPKSHDHEAMSLSRVERAGNGDGDRGADAGREQEAPPGLTS